MGIWDHYSTMGRRRWWQWQPRRCACGLLLWRCPDWNARVARQQRNHLGISEVTR
jgi:hypothetical protein